MSRGFTLLETLVAVLILGFLLVGLSGGARFGVEAAVRQARTSTHGGDLDAADRALRQLLASADPAAPLTGTADRMAFAGMIPGDPGLKSVGLGLRNGRLVLRYQPKPPGLALVPQRAEEVELATGLRALSLSYYTPGDGEHPVPEWRTAWSRPELPPLVRLRLSFTDPAAHWPDLVLATERRR